ncbi:tetratricopeptide repeat protein [uncultured Roseobacter sp.]|uniref:tetratricopeptide repeat protein n=1 Tax=uncultured Roseobacter sp. TaxID=114847 RepID=UPI00261D2735|nr:tetratricopeptide repeat protein [uncultured Roseobacter sp.]
MSTSASTIFVDREEPKRTFERAVFAIPEDSAIIRTWYGVGGQGKTALARELFRMSSKEADPSFAHLRRAMLDLHGRPKTDPDRLMVWVRNAFARSGVAFRAFDLAFAVMWEKTRGEEPMPTFESPWLHRTGEAVTDALPEVITLTREFIEETAGTVPVLGYLLKRGSGWAIDRGKAAWIKQTHAQLQALYRDGQMIANYEMSALMPWMLAQDLNRHIADYPDERFVLFVDEYESVMEGAGTGARWRENPFDASMRTLVAETNGLLATFFSRERLPWEEDADWRDDLVGNQHLLGGLADGDADAWLRKVPIEGETIRAAIIEGARETQNAGDPIYPLMLDLQVEHWRNLGDAAVPKDFHVEATGFEPRRLQLVQRLLRDYDAPIQEVVSRLSVAQRFDRPAFAHVVTMYNIPLAFSAFEQVTDLSIMSIDEDGWAAPHRAIADAIVQSTGDEFVMESREALLDHYAERALPGRAADVTDKTVACFAEAARLRRQKGIDGYVEWLEETGKKLEEAQRSRFLEHIWREAFEHARAALGEDHPDTGASYNNVASNLDDQGRYEEAEPLYQKGLEIRRAALGEDHPDTGTSYNNVASNLNARRRYEEAEPLFRKGLEIRRAALGDDHPYTGVSYSNVASNLDDQGRYEEAEPLYQEAVRVLQSLPEGHPWREGAVINLEACQTKIIGRKGSRSNGASVEK